MSLLDTFHKYQLAATPAVVNTYTPFGLTEVYSFNNLNLCNTNMTIFGFLISFGLLQLINATLYPKARFEVNGAKFAHFKKYPGVKLSGYPLRKFGVKGFEKCLVECVGHKQCLSTNVYTQADARGLFECELLEIDKYQYVNNLAPANGVEHYALPVR